MHTVCNVHTSCKILVFYENSTILYIFRYSTYIYMQHSPKYVCFKKILTEMGVAAFNKRVSAFCDRLIFGQISA